MGRIRLMQGLTVASLKHHPSLLPLLGAIGLGAVAAGGYLTRLATRNIDVSWDKKNNPLPYQNLKHTDQYKFYAVSIDYKNLPDHRPNIPEMNEK